MKKIRSYDELEYLLATDSPVYLLGQDGKYQVAEAMANVRALLKNEQGKLFHNSDLGQWKDSDIKWLYDNDYIVLPENPFQSTPAYTTYTDHGKCWIMCNEANMYKFLFFKNGNRNLSDPDFAVEAQSPNLTTFIENYVHQL